MITKRIIGLPGDIVQHLRKKDKQVRIPQGHCWIEGDEAFHSKDSNSFGPVSYFFFCNDNMNKTNE